VGNDVNSRGVVINAPKQAKWKDREVEGNCNINENFEDEDQSHHLNTTGLYRKPSQQSIQESQKVW
jgi:hypothetical protein